MMANTVTLTSSDPFIGDSTTALLIQKMNRFLLFIRYIDTTSSF